MRKCCGSKPPHTPLRYFRSALALVAPLLRKSRGMIGKVGKMAKHRIDCSDVDEVDEISGENQLARAWCKSHKRYEWHWLPRQELRAGSMLVVDRNPVFP